jgi:dTDP-4-amino-4,6-dideoxygalactose transaminase
MQQMSERGIGLGIHYPIPIHLQEAYTGLGYERGSFPIAERCATEFLSLPMFPELSRDQTSAVVAALKDAVAATNAFPVSDGTAEFAA